VEVLGEGVFGFPQAGADLLLNLLSYLLFFKGGIEMYEFLLLWGIEGYESGV